MSEIINNPAALSPPDLVEEYNTLARMYVEAQKVSSRLADAWGRESRELRDALKRINELEHKLHVATFDRKRDY